MVAPDWLTVTLQSGKRDLVQRRFWPGQADFPGPSERTWGSAPPPTVRPPHLGARRTAFRSPRRDEYSTREVQRGPSSSNLLSQSYQSRRQRLAAPEKGSRVSESHTRNALMAQTILDTATRLFDERGYTQTRMQDIAEAMDVTRPSLYYYYKNKEEILAALLLDLVSADKVLEGVELSQSPLEQLRELMLRIGFQVVEQPARLRIINRNFSQIPEDFRKDFARQRRRVINGLVERIEAAIKAGDLRPVDPELTTSIIFGAISGIADWYRPPTPGMARETVEAITSALLDGITLPVEGRHDGTAKGVIDRIREDLTYLERVCETSEDGSLPSKN
ncbi:TetR/AcrR family transcriptional regulator [Georgenia yuyongxinii]|uniref:TetR/AcrR family transcriptional regulator n=2 Tax=Georgenia yuyongxinii TaxID=2589797 RepID=A0A552WYF1_9MICO|nr:TetR/AcrR family transcriptional regulator [Georgenia yuyongxinii]